VESSQGSYVRVNGSLVGKLIAVTPSNAAASAFDVTHIGGQVIGSGGNAQTVRQINCAMVEPTTVTCQILGTPGFSINSGVANVQVGVGTYGVSGEAYVDKFQAEAKVGDFIRCSVTFQFTGF